MKLRELRYLLGSRPKPRRYGYTLRTFELPKDGAVHYAQWLHPSETLKVIRQDAVDELRRYIGPGDMAMDIGAHTGDSTLAIALAAGASGLVLALEPNPYVFPILERNASLNTGKTNIAPFKIAAMPEGGEYEFEYSDSGFCNGGLHKNVSKWRHGHAFALKVRGEHLPAFFASQLRDRHLRYLKVDAEGYDAEILQSLRMVLLTHAPYVRAEIYKLTSPQQREQLIDFLRRLGYDVFHVDSESHYEGEEVTRENVMAWRHYDIFCLPR